MQGDFKVAVALDPPVTGMPPGSVIPALQHRHPFTQHMQVPAAPHLGQG